MAGVLWVSSKIVEPAKLSVEQLDDWYENEHALEVLRLPGIPSGTRYVATNPTNPSPFLITYEFPDLSYTSSPSFQAVATQTPDQQLVNRIYAHASFDIRFYSEFAIPAHSPSSAPPVPTSAPLLASIAIAPLSGKEGAAEVWVAGKFALGLKHLTGFVRARRFEFLNGVLRERNVVSVPGAPKWLALVEFEDGATEVSGELDGVLGEEGLVEVSVEWYRVKKVWREGDVEKVGQVP
ncbi:hypothetical protein EKO04_005669 [Ascochyta lentis]|uniref:Uncharacterized protein n=1 Tax=Ascochyta lentis TaxID=205686 RepID=A0A8H7J1A8_9PLEO|nr:hypothetical protein EKO04_005669 [Ascochyta lentis]